MVKINTERAQSRALRPVRDFGRAAPLKELCAGLVERLLSRRSEIERVILAHVSDSASFGTAGAGTPSTWRGSARRSQRSWVTL